MAKVPKSLFQISLVGCFSGKDKVLLYLGARAPSQTREWWVREMNSVSRCPHKYLGGLAGGEKRAYVLLRHFWTLGTRAVSPAPFLKKGDRRRKVMPLGNPFGGTQRKQNVLHFFNQIFIRGVNRRLHPLAVPQADECTRCVRQS